MISKQFERPQFPFHAFFFSLYPILFILAHNTGQVRYQDAWMPAAWILGLTLTALVLLSFLFKNVSKAGMLVSVFLILFFSFGHVFELILGKQIAGFTYGRYRYLMAVWLGLFVLAVLGIARMKKSEGWTKALNVLSFILVVTNASVLMGYEFKNAKAGSDSGQKPESLQIAQKETGQNAKPDVYYIILDGYGRSDVLREVLDFDNSGFIEFLKAKGFVIAGLSHSNYSKTYLSLGASLNMEYLDSALTGIDKTSQDQGPIARIIRENRVVSMFKQSGYKIVSFSTGYTLTEKIDGTDLYYDAPGGLSEFDNILLNTTPIPWLNGSTVTVQQYDKHRSRILTIFEKLPEIAKNPAPTFTFAHILAPHQPFVFGPNGEKKNPKGSFSLLERGTPEEYKKDYLGQVVFVTRKIQEAIEGILKNSPDPPLIVIQSDHGPIYSAMPADGKRSTFEKNWNHPTPGILKERMSILNAYYLPGGGSEKIYPEITPVNTFRIILNYYLGQNLEMLKDESFFSLGHDYHFVKAFGESESVNSPGKTA